MKKLLIVLSGIALVLIAAVFAVPAMVPVGTYKREIVRQVGKATGRELAILGPVRFSLLPRLEVEANDVTFSNPPWASDPQMASLDQLLVVLKLWPLLSGEVAVDRFVLVKPVIRLEVDESGRGNWILQQADASGSASEAEPRTTGADGSTALSELRLGDIRIVNGAISYADVRSGDRYVVSQVDLGVSLPSLDDPLTVDGALRWNDQNVDVDLRVERPRGLLDGEASPAELTVASEPLQMSYDGRVVGGDRPSVAGEVEVSTPSVRRLSEWAGSPLDMSGSGLGPFSLNGKVEATVTSAALSDARIVLDEIRATGEVRVDLAGAKPSIEATLDVGTLDLNPYIPPEAAGGDAAGAGTNAGGGAAAPAEWSDEPLDLSGLRAANANMALSAQAIRVGGLNIGRSALKVVLHDGRLEADLTELHLYDGAGTGRLVLDARGEVPAVEKRFELTGIQAEPLLSDASDFDRLEGTGDLRIAVAARGRSQRQMVQAVNGDGAFSFKDGAIKGINIAAMARNLATAFLDPKARETQKTDFSALSGTFRIERGVLRNDDLELVSPLLRVAGSGTADLPKRTVDYRVDPAFVGSLEGQGRSDAGGVTLVPVKITGPWHDLQYRPDLAGVVSGAIENPKKALDAAGKALKDAGEAVGKGLGGGLGGSPPAEKDDQTDGQPAPDPGRVLKKLFGD